MGNIAEIIDRITQQINGDYKGNGDISHISRNKVPILEQYMHYVVDVTTKYKVKDLLLCRGHYYALHNVILPENVSNRNYLLGRIISENGDIYTKQYRFLFMNTDNLLLYPVTCKSKNIDDFVKNVIEVS